MPVPTPNPLVDMTFNDQLILWAKLNGVRPIDLHRDTGWSEQHCYRLFAGKDKFGHAALGLFTLVYGMDALNYILKKANVQFAKEK